MSFHRNAKLGLAGRYALVLRNRGRDDAEGGRGLASACHRRQRTAGGIAGARQARRRGGRCRVSSIAPAVRTARRANSRPSSPRRSAPAAGRRAGDRGSSPAPPASATRPSGRCSSGPASRGRREHHVSPPTATSGPVPAICCTWTRASTPASSDPATASPAIAARKTVSTETASTSCTRSSTTTSGLPTPRSTTTSSASHRRRLSRASARLLRIATASAPSG